MSGLVGGGRQAVAGSAVLAEVRSGNVGLAAGRVCVGKPGIVDFAAGCVGIDKPGEGFLTAWWGNLVAPTSFDGGEGWQHGTLIGVRLSRVSNGGADGTTKDRVKSEQ